jgi:hypothetical protein
LCAVKGRPGNANVLCAYTRHCDSVVNNECYINDVYRIIFHTNCPTDTEGIQVDDVEWCVRDDKYDDITYADAYQEAKDTVTAGPANTCPVPMDASLVPPDSIAHQREFEMHEPTDSEDGFNMELDVY